MNNSGILYVVSTPIGNDDDISLRALKVLKTCDIVVCEEGKVGAKLLRQHKISQPIEELNEHNEDTTATVLLEQLRAGKNLALISDAGTPLLADPGLALVKLAIKHNVPINVVPGASSVLTGLVRSGLPSNQFLFAGFVSRKPDERITELKELSREKRTVVLLETPYRLLPLLEAAHQVMPKRAAYLGCNLTLPFETHHYGTFAELFAKFSEEKFKGEFVLCFAGNPNAIDEVTAPVEKLAKEFFDESDRNKGFQHSSDSERKPRFDRTKKDFQKPRSAGGYERRDNDEDRPAGKFNDDRRSSGERRPPFKKFDDDRRSGERPPFKKFDDDRRSGERRPPFKKFDDDRRGGGSDRPPFKKFDDDRRGGGSDRPPFKKFDDDRRSDGDRRPPFKKFDNRNSGGEERREGGEFRSEGFSGGFKGKKPFKKFGGGGKFGAGRGGARSKSRR